MSLVRFRKEELRWSWSEKRLALRKPTKVRRSRGHRESSSTRYSNGMATVEMRCYTRMLCHAILWGTQLLLALRLLRVQSVSWERSMNTLQVEQVICWHLEGRRGQVSLQLQARLRPLGWVLLSVPSPRSRKWYSALLRHGIPPIVFEMQMRSLRSYRT